jgi:hypothetical protein
MNRTPQSIAFHLHRCAFALLAACTAAPPAPPAAPPIVLREVTSAAGLPAASQMCLVFRDFDRDGLPDLLLAPVDAQGTLPQALVLYRNDGHGAFSPHSIPVPLNEVAGCDAADYDADGFLDLAVVGSGATGGAVLLLHNTGGSGLAFEDASALLPAVHDPDPRVAHFFDYDNDGWPDLHLGFFIGNARGGGNITDHCDASDSDFNCYLVASAPAPRPSLLLHNRGGAAFEQTVALDPHYNTAVATLDWDGDGRVDLFCADDFGINAFYRNQAAATFTDWLPAWHANPRKHGMGVAIADFNRDGLWDFYACVAGPDEFYFGTSDGAVVDRAAALGVADATRFHSGWSPQAQDFNNDGWLDLYVMNAGLGANSSELTAIFLDPSPQLMVSAEQADFLFTSRGGTQFDVASLPNGVTVPYPAWGGAAVADYDGDGGLDLALVYANDFPKLRLLHNESPGRGHWLDVRLVGKPPNRDALGAIVTLDDADAGPDRRSVGAGGSEGASTEILHFGLGQRTSVGPLRIRWPGTTTDQPYDGPITADQTLLITQP